MPDPIPIPNPPPLPEQPKKQRGCWFYGCLSLAIIALIGLVGTWMLARFAVKKASAMVQQYTSKTSAPIEKVTISQSDLKSLQGRVNSFNQTLNGEKGSRELVLSADEINALIQNDPEYKAVKGKLFVMLDGDQIRGKVSMPLDDFGPFKLKGDYLNGTATLTAALENGVLDVRLKDIQVGDNPLPAPILAELRKMNFAQDFQKDPDVKKSMDKLESIQVKDSKLILRSKEPPK
jgi:hypothetical protein